MSESVLENLFLEVCGKYLDDNGGFDVRGELGVFSSAAVVWLGIQQRIKGGSLQSSLGSLIEKIKSGSAEMFMSRPSRKAREGEISLNTGGISRARDRLSLDLVKNLYESATKQIEHKLKLRGEKEKPGIYIMDGQVTAIARTSSNLETFGPTGNGEGELHYPRIRIVTAHRLSNGIATKVAIGNWHDSEVGLGREVLE